MILGLIRHGQTDWNKMGRIQGQTDIPLNEEGMKQAQRLAQYLRRGDIVWDAIYSSDLKRARLTADIIKDGLQLTDVRLDDRLRERAFGLAEGLTAKEREERFGQDLTRAGSEPEAEILLRGRQFLDEIEGTEAGRHVLIVSHGAFLKRLLSLLIPDLPDAYIENASLTIVRRVERGWELLLHNYKATTLDL